eukprot:6466329-Amphidinium_carterae.2
MDEFVKRDLLSLRFPLPWGLSLWFLAKSMCRAGREVHSGCRNRVGGTVQQGVSAVCLALNARESETRCSMHFQSRCSEIVYFVVSPCRPFLLRG